MSKNNLTKREYSLKCQGENCENNAVGVFEVKDFWGNSWGKFLYCQSCVMKDMNNGYEVSLVEQI